MSQKKKNLFQAFVLLLLIVILPFGSWYYMGAGHQYYKQSMSELKDYGTLPAFSLSTQNGKMLSPEQMEGKMGVVVFVNPQSSDAELILHKIQLLHQQFDKRNDLYFLIHLLSDTAVNSAAMEGLAKKYKLTDEDQCYFLTGNSMAIKKLAGSDYQVPDLTLEKKEDTMIPLRPVSPENLNEYPYLVLVDSKHQIRNYYDPADNKAMKRMVEHIALILPKEVDDKPVLKREKEK